MLTRLVGSYLRLPMALLAAFFLAEGTAYVALYLTRGALEEDIRQTPTNRLEIDPLLGWRRYLDPGRLVQGNSFNEHSEAFAIQVRLFEAFAEVAREWGMSVFVVFFPDRDVLAQARVGRGPVYGPLVTATRRRGIVALDLLETLLDAERALPPSASLFAPGGHYSATGNAVVARMVGERLLSEDERILAILPFSFDAGLNTSS